MGKNKDLKDWEEMTKVEQLAYLKKIDSHPNQMQLEFKNYSFGDTEVTRRIFYRIKYHSTIGSNLNTRTKSMFDHYSFITFCIIILYYVT